MVKIVENELAIMENISNILEIIEKELKIFLLYKVEAQLKIHWNIERYLTKNFILLSMHKFSSQIK